MPNYKYKARDQAGKIQSGIVSSQSLGMAKTVIARKKMRIIALKEVTLDAAGKESGGLVLFGGRLRIDGQGNVIFGSSEKFKVPDKDLIIMTKQLSTMLGSGLPLNQSLELLSRQQRLPQFGEIIGGIRRGIEEGNSLSTAMGRYPAAFDSLFRAMIKAGEESGRLPEIMSRLLTYIEKSAKIKQQVKSAMTYPVLILLVATIVVTGLLVFVVPSFTSQFKDSGRELPWLTQMVIDVSDGIAHYFLHISAVIAATIFGLMKYIETAKGRFIFDSLLLKVPIIGDVMRKISVGRFCSTMSSMLSAGVNLLQALTICASSSGNVVMQAFIMTCRTKIEKGFQLSQPLAENAMFPTMVVSMIQVGEQSGKMDEMLMKIAFFYEDEVDDAIKTMLSLIEPIMLVGIGVIIGVIVIAMYLPIMDMGNTVGS
jgi:type IV pilus assembly protein PilC